MDTVLDLVLLRNFSLSDLPRSVSPFNWFNLGLFFLFSNTLLVLVLLLLLILLLNHYQLHHEICSRNST
jgi:hypothetical protein